VQVTEEGEEEAKQVAAAAAALCLQMKGDDRPTMRHGETILHRIQSSNDNYQDDPGVQAGMELRNTTFEGINNVGVHDNNSRRLVWREKCCCRQAFLGEPVLGVKMTICKNKMCTINASI
jgi:hypothetical protein